MQHAYKGKPDIFQKFILHKMHDMHTQIINIVYFDPYCAQYCLFTEKV